MGIQVLDFLASSANLWASSSRMKSASNAISVFHSLRPPKSFSPAFKEISSADVIASALVAAINNAMELLFGLSK